MKNDEKTMEMIQDYARVSDFLTFLCGAINGANEVPNVLPMCSDLTLVDQLDTISTFIAKHKKSDNDNNKKERK